MLERLATFKKKDYNDQMNIDVAMNILEENNLPGLMEIIMGLKNPKIVKDCLVVLVEIVNHNKDLLVDYYESFLFLLNSKNDEDKIKALYILSKICPNKTKEIYQHLDKILEIYSSELKFEVIDSVFLILGCFIKESLSKKRSWNYIRNYLSDCEPNQILQKLELTRKFLDQTMISELQNLFEKRDKDLTENQKKQIQEFFSSYSIE